MTFSSSAFLRSIFTGLALAASAHAWAAGGMDLVGDDTDLFMTNPTISSEIPNVLIVVDNTTNWSAANQQWPAVVDPACQAAGITGNKQGDAEICAIYKQVSLLTASVNVGLMMFNKQDQGAYVRFPVVTMDPNTPNPANFKSLLSTISTNGPTDTTSSNGVYTNPLNDAFRYLNSLGVYSPGAAITPPANVAGYTSPAMTSFSFANPSTSSCGFDFIIFIGNGFPKKDDNSSGTQWPANGAVDMKNAASLLNDPNVTVNTTPIQNTGSDADVWSRFLYQYGVKISNGVYRHVTTYTIDVCSAQCDPNQATLLNSMANVSFGTYYKATDLSSLSLALSSIFAQVQSVSSVFAATTLPVSINVRGTNLNQVYIGVFKPDAHLRPRWDGNLKLYQLGLADATTGRLQLVDANQQPAVNLNTGFVANTATSFWTTSSSFWAYQAPFPPTNVGGASDLPDGDIVEKGGAAERIRVIYPVPDSTTAQTRNIYTRTSSCTGSPLSACLFNDANTDITAQALGTFATFSVISLSASGQTATAITSSAHGFSPNDQVTVSGASPNLYNGVFAVISVPNSTTFTYTLSSSPDVTDAFAAFPGYGGTLTPGSDLVTVTGATPPDYNVTKRAISAVPGDSNTFKYALPTGSSPTQAASGYTVTGVRLIPTGGLTWSSGSSGTGKATVVLTNHGYSTGDMVTIENASDSGMVPAGTLDPAFNGTFAITKVDNNSFTYSPTSTPVGGKIQTGVVTINPSLPSSWTSGITVQISGVTNNTNYNATSAISGATGNTFVYNTVSPLCATPPCANASGTSIVAQRVVASDTSTWTISNAVLTGSGNNTKIRLTLSRGQYSGQLLHTLATTPTLDTIAIANCTYATKSGNVTTTNNCSGLPIAAVSGNSGTTTTPVAAGVYADISGTVTVDLTPTSANSVQSVSVTATALGATPGTGATLITWTGQTVSAAQPVTSIVPGTASVTATTATGFSGIYASKTGDLTSKVTLISNQSVASGTITAGLASVADPLERTHLINWVRGQDNKENENQDCTVAPYFPCNTTTNTVPRLTDIRASVHGDVLHSRPAVINYSRDGTNNDVFVFYGANDGMLHAAKGGLTDASTNPNAGNEQWAFVAPEFFGKLKRLRNQSPTISSASPRDYFFDGPIGVYTLDVNNDGKLVAADGDKVYLFIAMRRGGRYIYALDVSDPVNPKFMWKKGCPNPTGTTGCDTGYEDLGQAWSQPQLGYLRAFPNQVVMMFAAGYDAPVEDFQPCVVTSWDGSSVTAKTGVVFPNPMDTASCPPSTGTSSTVSRTMGRGIYIVDALTGSLLWRAGPGVTADLQVAGMTFAMPGDMAVLRNRSNTAPRTTTGTESVPIGYLDRIYAEDTGGNVWRVDVADADKTKWVVSKLASIAPTGAASTAAGTPASASMRKFMFSPDVVYSHDGSGDYDAVLIGSGDREHPFDQTVANRFYMFKDRSTGTIAAGTTPPATITESNLFDVTNDCLQDPTLCSGGQTQTTAASALAASSGWMLQLTNTGEKTIAQATTAAGSVIFNTNQPKQDTVTGTANNTTTSGPSNACTSDLGTARQYAINYQDATSNNIYSYLPSQFQSSTGRFAVFAGGGYLPAPVPVVVQIGGKYYQTVISGVTATPPGGLSLQARVRTYWYKKSD